MSARATIVLGLLWLAPCVAMGQAPERPIRGGQVGDAGSASRGARSRRSPRSPAAGFDDTARGAADRRLDSDEAEDADAATAHPPTTERAASDSPAHDGEVIPSAPADPSSGDASEGSRGAGDGSSGASDSGRAGAEGAGADGSSEASGPEVSGDAPEGTSGESSSGDGSEGSGAGLGGDATEGTSGEGSSGDASEGSSGDASDSADASFFEDVRYLLERVEVRGNDEDRHRRHPRFVPAPAGRGPRRGRAARRVDPMAAARTGWFDDVRLSVERGSRRGHVVLVVQVTERNTFTVAG